MLKNLRRKFYKNFANFQFAKFLGKVRDKFYFGRVCVCVCGAQCIPQAIIQGPKIFNRIYLDNTANH